MSTASSKMLRSDALGRIKGAQKALPAIIRSLEALVADQVPGAAEALKRIGFARTALDRAQDALAEQPAASSAEGA